MSTPPPPPPPPPGPSPQSNRQYPGGRSRQFQRQNVVVTTTSPPNTSNNTTSPSQQQLPSPPSRPSPSLDEQQQQQHVSIVATRPERVQIGGTEIPFVAEGGATPSKSSQQQHDDQDDIDFVAKKNRRAIRRAGSFTKLTNLSQQMEHWFFTDEALHKDIKNFVKTLPRDLIGKAVSADMHSVNLTAQEHHQTFCELFEEHLEKMLEERNVDFEAFTERIRLDKEEEERDGSHFYRWLEVIEFPQFILLLTPPTKLIEDNNGDVAAASLQNLLEGIKALSQDARRKFRKASILTPLMWAWSPSSFASFDEVLQTSLKKIGLSGGINDLKLSKADAKAMVRWKQKLKTPALNEQGVYAPPPVHHDEFVSYISSVSVGMDDDLFDKFIVSLRAQINVVTASDDNRLDDLKKKNSSEGGANKAVLDEAEDLMISIEQRLLLELFFELDVRHQGRVPLYSALKFMLQAGAISSEKEIKRTLLRFRHTAKKQPGEVFLEHQKLEEEEKLKRRNSSFIGSRRGSVLDASGNSLNRGNSSVKSENNHDDDHEDEDEENQENADDPLVSFHHFLGVVKDPLHAVFKQKTAKKVVVASASDDNNDKMDISPVFQYHNEFVERVNNLRAVWKDKQ